MHVCTHIHVGNICIHIKVKKRTRSWGTMKQRRGGRRWRREGEWIQFQYIVYMTLHWSVIHLAIQPGMDPPMALSIHPLINYHVPTHQLFIHLPIHLSPTHLYTKIYLLIHLYTITINSTTDHSSIYLTIHTSTHPPTICPSTHPSQNFQRKEEKLAHCMTYS